jgi:phosphatidylglycerophosphate synthase
MDWKFPVSLLISVVGIILFLYGSNYYNNAVGWAGVYLFFTGIIIYILWSVYSYFMKRKS